MRIRLPARRRPAWLLLLLLTPLMFACTRNRTCLDPDPTFCAFTTTIAGSLVQRDAEYALNRLAFTAFDCPVEVSGVEPCGEHETTGVFVRRTSQPSFHVGEGSVVGEAAMISTDSYGERLGHLLSRVEPGARDGLGGGGFRVYSTGEERRGEQRAVIVTAIVRPEDEAQGGRIALAFEAVKAGGEWWIDRTATIAPDPAAPQMWLKETSSRWLWRKWTSDR